MAMFTCEFSGAMRTMKKCPDRLWTYGDEEFICRYSLSENEHQCCKRGEEVSGNHWWTLDSDRINFIDQLSANDWRYYNQVSDGHMWAWALEQCLSDIKVRWHDWKPGHYLGFDCENDLGEVYMDRIWVYSVKRKRYFTEAKWVLFDAE